MSKYSQDTRKMKFKNLRFDEELGRECMKYF